MKIAKKTLTEIGEKLGLGKIQFDDIFRIGKPGSRNRPLFVRLLRTWDKKAIMRARGKLKDRKIFINDDLDEHERKINSTLITKLKELQTENAEIKGTIRFGVLTATLGDKHERYQVNEAGDVMQVVEEAIK